MSKCFVPCCVDPDDAAVPRLLGDAVGQGGEGPGPGAVAVTPVVEAARHVDHVDPVFDRVVLRATKVDDRVDADQVELGSGRYLVHDLRDGRAVRVTSVISVGAEAAGREGAGQLARVLLGQEVREAGVEDGDRDAGAVEAAGVRVGRVDRPDSLSGHGC